MNIHNDLAQMKANPTDLGIYDSAVNGTDKLYKSFDLPSPPAAVLPEPKSVDFGAAAAVSPNVANIIQGLRNSSNKPSQPQGLMSTMPSSSKPQSALFQIPKNIITVDTLSDMTYKNLLGDTKLKYDSYEVGRDNEELQAQKQTRLEKWGKGVTAMVGKSLVHAIGGTVGLAVGIGEWIAQGNFNAFYNNDFAKSLDDLNKSIDDSLAIYKTQEEKNMNFLEQMTTASFWAKDFTDAGAFVLGAVIVGKGTGLLTRGLPKAAMRASFGSSARTIQAARNATTAAESARLMSTIKSPIKRLLHSALNGGSELRGGLVGAYQNAANVGRVVKGLNTFGQVTMAATYEAGVESRQALESMRDNYLKMYREHYGHEPSPEEMATFMEDAVTKSNMVFMANVPLVAIGNYATVGRILGWQTPKFLSRIGDRINPLRWGERTALAGVSRTATGFVFEAPKGFAKYGKKFYSLMSAPIKEGLVEEGGQNFVSTFAENYMKAKYDPDATAENLSFMKEMGDALLQAYGTKDGWKEIGMGMLIGFLGNSTGRVAQSARQGKGFMGSVGSFFGTEYGDELRRGREFVDSHNALIDAQNEAGEGWLSTQQTDAFNRLGVVNQQRVADGKAELSKDEREKQMIYRANQMAQYRLARQYGMEDFIGEQMLAQIDALTTEDMNASGIREDKHQEYKDFLKEQVTRQLEIDEQASTIAENLHENLMSQAQLESFAKLGVSYEDLVTMTAQEIAMGYDAVERVQDQAKELEKLLGVEGAGSAIMLRQRISETKAKQVEERNKLQNERNELAKRQQELENVLVNERKRTLTQSSDIASNAEKKNEKLNSVLSEITENEQKLREIDNRIEAINHRQVKLDGIDADALLGGITKGLEFWGDGIAASETELDASFQKLQQLDDLVKGVREELRDPNTSEDRKRELEEWLDKYSHLVANIRQDVAAYQTLHRNFTERTSPRYAFSRFSREFSKKNRDKEVEIDKDASDYFKEKWQEVEKIIENSELSAYQEYQFRANAKIYFKQRELHLFDNDALSAAIAENDEVITDAMWEQVQNGVDVSGLKENIADKLNSNVNLSLREREVYAKFKKEIDGIVENLQLEQGDSMSYGFSNGQQTNTEVRRDKPFLEALKEVIDSFIATNNRLSRDIVSNVEKPTKEDYEHFRDLHKKKTGRDEKGKMTDKKTREKLMQEFAENEDEYEALKEKINNWGVVSGTIANGVRLSDLIELYEELSAEEQQTSQNRVTQTEVSLDDLLSENESEAEWQGNKKGRRFDIAQVYDLAMVSKDKDGNFVLHHYGVDNLIEDVQQQYPDSNIRVVGVEHISGNKPIYQSDKISTYSAVEFQIENEDGSVTQFEVKIDAQNNLVFPEEVAQHLGSLRLMQIPSISRNYQPLYRENEDGTFEQVRSSFSGGIDTQATKEVRKGDVLNAEIDLNDPYTKSLVDNYKKALAEAKGDGRNAAVKEAKKALEDKMVIRLVDSKGRVVSVMKSNANSQDLQESATAPAMIKYRKNAVSEVVKAISENPDVQLVRLGKKGSVSVESVMLGVPNVRVSRNEDGEVVVVSKTLSEQDEGKIVDVGYMLDGHIHSKNGTTITAGHNLLNQYKKDKHKGNRIPLVFIRENGQVVAYSAHLQSKGNLEEQFDEIVANNDPTQAAIKLNKLMYDNGISTQLFGLTPNMIVENSPEFQSARQQAVNHNLYSDPEMWVTDDVSMEDVLSQDIEVNLDMQGDAFAAPKLQINYGNSNEVVNEDNVELDDKSGTTADNLSPLPSNPNSQVESKGRKTHKDKDGNVYEDYYKGVDKTFTFKGENYKVVRSIIDGDKSLLMLLNTESGEVITEADIMKSHSMTTAVNKWVKDNVGKKEPSPIITMGESIPVNKKAEKVEDKPITTEVEQPSVEEELEKELQDEDNRKAIDEIITPYDENTEYNEENPDYIDVERKVSDLMGDSFNEWVESERVNNRERVLKPFREEVDKFFEGKTKSVDTYTDERFQDSDSFLVLEKKGKKIKVQFNFLGNTSRINKEGTFNTEEEVREFLEDTFNNSFEGYEYNVGLSTLQNKFNELSADNKIRKINYNDVSEVDKPTEMLSQVVEKRNKC